MISSEMSGNRFNDPEWNALLFDAHFSNMKFLDFAALGVVSEHP
jgi:hypothetical protein